MMFREHKKLKIGLIAWTCIMLLGSVLAWTGLFVGLQVKVVGINLQIEYSLTNSDVEADWTTSLDNVLPSVAWYARCRTLSSGYVGTIHLTWDIYIEGTLISLHTEGPFSFSTSGIINQLIYCSPDGSRESNYNWGLHTSEPGNYHIEVLVGT